MGGLGRQAKVLTADQVDALLAHVATTAAPVRNRAIVLLNFKAGLRAHEIGGLRWRMVLTAARAIDRLLSLENIASKGRRGGRQIPMHPLLHVTLATLYVDGVDPDDFVLRFRKGSRHPEYRSAAVQQLFRSWYRALKFTGASSHSGRRTFITGAARNVSRVHASLRDVQQLAGHKHLATTQGYIDIERRVHRDLVELA